MDDELFKAGETRRHLQLASGLFLDIDFQHHAIGGGAGLLLYLQIFLEIAERLDTVARTLDLEAVERIPFGKAELAPRSEEHTSELQSLMRISYAVFCLKKKTKQSNNTEPTTH